MAIEPVYIVTGFYRSGTSMMMHCLILGGMKASWSSVIDESLRSLDESYDPNPNGFYELDSGLIDGAFPKIYSGNVVKIHWRSLSKLPEGDYQLLFMTRPPAEIKASLQFAYPGDPEESACDFYDLITPIIIDKFKAQTVAYHDVLNDPQTSFKQIGWPVDAALAATGVDQSLYRNRLVG